MAESLERAFIRALRDNVAGFAPEYRATIAECTDQELLEVITSNRAELEDTLVRICGLRTTYSTERTVYGPENEGDNAGSLKKGTWRGVPFNRKGMKPRVSSNVNGYVASREKKLAWHDLCNAVLMMYMALNRNARKKFLRGLRAFLPGFNGGNPGKSYTARREVKRIRRVILNRI